MWKKLRIALLLYILVLVAITSWSTSARHAEWDQSLWVTLYPINGDGSAVSQQYIGSLSESDFSTIEEYIVAETSSYNLTPRLPIDIKFSDQIRSLPPMPPGSSSGFGVMLWSLKLRWWAWRVDNFDGPSDIKIFVLYFDPEENRKLRHSLGLQKGFLGVVNAFADESYAGQNNVVITHELMHTLGASDQYDPATNQPLHPDGYADPLQHPLHPQRKATLMAGRIPLSAHESEMPGSLQQTIVSPRTAIEVGWRK